MSKATDNNDVNAISAEFERLERLLEAGQLNEANQGLSDLLRGKKLNTQQRARLSKVETQLDGLNSQSKRRQTVNEEKIREDIHTTLSKLLRELSKSDLESLPDYDNVPSQQQQVSSGDADPFKNITDIPKGAPPKFQEEIPPQATVAPPVDDAVMANSAVPTHPDRPVAIDELGREVMARALAKRIQLVRKQDEKRLRAAEEKEETSGQDASVLMGPFRVNLYGPWGSGKSTLLNFLRSELQSGRDLTREEQEAKTTDPWVVVWFNAWEHQRISPPWWSLMDSVYRQASTQLWKQDKAQWLFLKITEFSWRIMQSWSPLILAIGLLLTFFSAAIWLEWVTFSGAGNTLISALGEQAKNISAILALMTTIWGSILAMSRGFMLGSSKSADNFQRNRTDPMHRLTSHFEKMIGRIGLPVAVFVDDLDRCTTSYIVELLEGVQTIYGHAPLTYVIAADRRWIRTAYETSYEDFSAAVSEPGRNLGTLFLDKTFHLTVPVPAISSETQREYFERLIGMKPAQRTAEVRDARKKASDRLRTLQTESDILREVDEAETEPVLKRALIEEAVIRFAAPDVQARTEHALRSFAPLLESNPRAMKRFVNAYGIQRSLVTLAEIDISQQELALWTILDMRWPQLSELLEEHPDLIEFIGTDAVPGEDVMERLGDLLPLFEDRTIQRVVLGQATGVDAPS